MVPTTQGATNGSRGGIITDLSFQWYIWVYTIFSAVNHFRILLSSLGQIMACRLISAKQVSEPMIRVPDQSTSEQTYFI